MLLFIFKVTANLISKMNLLFGYLDLYQLLPDFLVTVSNPQEGQRTNLNRDYL